jgi:hypothetical protein
MSSHTPAHGSDKGAGFTGLIVGALFVGLILYSVVLLTNRHFAGEKGEKGTTAAESTK